MLIFPTDNKLSMEIECLIRLMHLIPFYGNMVIIGVFSLSINTQWPFAKCMVLIVWLTCVPWKSDMPCLIKVKSKPHCIMAIKWNRDWSEIPLLHMHRWNNQQAYLRKPFFPPTQHQPRASVSVTRCVPTPVCCTICAKIWSRQTGYQDVILSIKAGHCTMCAGTKKGGGRGTEVKTIWTGVPCLFDTESHIYTQTLEVTWSK